MLIGSESFQKILTREELLMLFFMHTNCLGRFSVPSTEVMHLSANDYNRIDSILTHLENEQDVQDIVEQLERMKTSGVKAELECFNSSEDTRFLAEQYLPFKLQEQASQFVH